MDPEQLLEAVAETLRTEIGPAVDEPFAKTQAFMAAVILGKLAAQLRLANAHAAGERRDRAALADDLDAILAAEQSGSVRAAIDAVREGGDAALRELISVLYAQRAPLGAERFDALLARVRSTLRAGLNRQLEFAS